jgi:hypothetical protein
MKNRERIKNGEDGREKKEGMRQRVKGKRK